MNGDQHLAFLFRRHGVRHSRRQDQHLSGSKFMYLASSRDFHAASQDVHVDNPVGLVFGQASESVEGEERDGVTAMTIQRFLPMAALNCLGFRAKSGDNGLEIERSLRGGEASFRMRPESFLTGMIRLHDGPPFNVEQPG